MNDLFNLLKEKMIESKVFGISAPELGIDEKVFVFGDYLNPDSIVGVIDPDILDYSKETNMFDESSFSYPGLILKIRRSNIIRARYTSQNGERNTIKLEGLSSRVFQQQVDYLNGIPFTKRCSLYHLEKAKKFKKLNDRKLKGNFITQTTQTKQ